MTEPGGDRICIQDLDLRCVIGTEPRERRRKQKVLINIILYVDLSKACASDRIEDTLDYKELKKAVVGRVLPSRYFLIERLAEIIADTCLDREMVRSVNVRVQKPGALRFARSVEVEINRERSPGAVLSAADLSGNTGGRPV